VLLILSPCPCELPPRTLSERRPQRLARGPGSSTSQSVGFLNSQIVGSSPRPCLAPSIRPSPTPSSPDGRTAPVPWRGRRCGCSRRSRMALFPRPHRCVPQSWCATCHADNGAVFWMADAVFQERLPRRRPCSSAFFRPITDWTVPPRHAVKVPATHHTLPGAVSRSLRCARWPATAHGIACRSMPVAWVAWLPAGMCTNGTLLRQPAVVVAKHVSSDGVRMPDIYTTVVSGGRFFACSPR
jgi:hypothetical protein